MNVRRLRPAEFAVAKMAAAIGEPARVRMLYCLLDGRARTSTELSVVAGVSPSTASVHLSRLKLENLVKLSAQGKHRYYSLEGPDVARALEGLSILAVGPRGVFVPSTPDELRASRTCYDHLAGRLAVLLHNRFKQLKWLTVARTERDDSFDLSREGAKAFESLGVDLDAARAMRRRFAYACMDWSERQPHIGGALGAGLLKAMLKRKWVSQELDSRALNVTRVGRKEIFARFGLQL